MGAYQYQALKKSGIQSRGVIEADSTRHARQLLREQGLIPIGVNPLKKTALLKHKDTLKATQLCLLTRQLATLLSAGVPLEESLRGLIEQAEDDKVRQIIIGVRSKVLEGYALAQAMNEYPMAFPDLYRATVASGEQTGHLDLVLEKLANYTENQQIIRQKVQHAMIYPCLMVMVSMGIVSFLLAFIVPKIIEVFTNSGQTLPLMTNVLIKLSQCTQSYGLYVLVIIGLCLFAFYKSLASPKIKLRWHKTILKLPIVSYLTRAVNVARYIHTFSILFAAGVSVLETMRVCASLINNVYMRQQFDQATLHVREGMPISSALKETKFLSPMAAHLIASGEKSGQLAPMMEKAAQHLDHEVKRRIDVALTLLEPLIILLMGGIVLFIVLATLLPIFSMEQLIT